MALTPREPPFRIQFQMLALKVRNAAPHDYTRFLEGLRGLFKRAVDETLVASNDALPLARGKAAGLADLIKLIEDAESDVTKFNSPNPRSTGPK